MAMSRDEIVFVLGSVDDELVAEFNGDRCIGRGTEGGMGLAPQRRGSDGYRAPPPGTRVGRLIEMLEPDEDEA